jgi:single-strand DNA-binding protein
MSNGSVNKVIIIGNLGSDPEVRELSSQMIVTRFSVATTTSWKDKNTGESKNKTEWHRIVCYGKLAEFTKNYLKKGMKIFLDGQLVTSVWEGRDGVKRNSTEVSINQLQILSPRQYSDKDVAEPVSEQDDMPF